ncbi:MAG: hypothetical protein ACRYGI_09250 [Janthinobacterium lividum]
MTPARLLPWDIHPALTEDRLRACALILAHARRDAVKLAEPALGDDAWSIGCRAYAFGKQRLQRAAARGTYNWLSVLDESHHFVFMIEDVPVRFFRGSADEPTVRTLRRQILEAQQLTMALGPEQAEGLVFRLALEATAGGDVDRVVFLALRGEDGQVECFWPVPLDVAPSELSGPAPTQLRLLGEDASDVLISAPGRPSQKPPNPKPRHRTTTAT